MKLLKRLILHTLLVIAVLALGFLAGVLAGRLWPRGSSHSAAAPAHALVAVVRRA